MLYKLNYKNSNMLNILALATYSREEEDREKEEEEKENNAELPKQGTCACEISKEELEEEVRERNLQIQFENFLHNSVYLKR